MMRGMSFIGWLAMALKTAFSAAAGQRSERQRRDPLHRAVSADAPAYQGETGPTVAELVPDESAALAFALAEWEDCRGLIYAALDSLPPGQGELLRRYYLRIDAAATAAGYASRYVAYEAIARALYRLAHGKYTQALRDCLDALTELEQHSFAARSTGIGSYQRAGMSATEARALR